MYLYNGTSSASASSFVRRWFSHVIQIADGLFWLLKKFPTPVSVEFVRLQRAALCGFSGAQWRESSSGFH
jgi:hypothetical protein